MKLVELNVNMTLYLEISNKIIYLVSHLKIEIMNKLFNTYEKYSFQHQRMVRKYRNGGYFKAQKGKSMPTTESLEINMPSPTNPEEQNVNLGQKIALTKSRMLRNLERVKPMLDRLGPTEYQKMATRIKSVETTDPNAPQLFEQINKDMTGAGNMVSADKKTFMNKAGERSGGGYSASENSGRNLITTYSKGVQ